MTFTEQWFPEQSQAILAGLAAEAADVPGRIVEVGSWEGRSTAALANAVPGRLVHCVDTWHGSPGEPSEALAAERDVFATWVANMAELTAGNVQPFRMGWRDYHAAWPTEPIALAFIDAEHSYNEVRDNIMAFLPLIAAGGILCGDDQHHPPVRQALFDTLPATEVYLKASMWWWKR